MCEIALCVAGPGVSSPMRYQPNDVIDCLPDGWNWGVLDQSNPNWRILKFPGVDPSVFAQFLQPQQPTAQQVGQPGVLLWRRAVSFNSSALPSAPSVAPNAVTAAKIAPYLADNTRASPALFVPLAATDVPTLAVTKAAITAGNVIGNTPSNVIG